MTALEPLAPSGEAVVDYDRRHLATYAALLDADDAGQDWRQAVRAILGVDTEDDDAQRCWRWCLRTLARSAQRLVPLARWRTLQVACQDRRVASKPDDPVLPARPALPMRPALPTVRLMPERYVTLWALSMRRLGGGKHRGM